MTAQTNQRFGSRRGSPARWVHEQEGCHQGVNRDRQGYGSEWLWQLHLRCIPAVMGPRRSRSVQPVAIVRKRLRLDASLYTLMRVFSVAVFEKASIKSFILQTPDSPASAT